MSHCIHKSIPDAKFEAGSSFSFWRYDVTKFPSKEGNESSNSAIYRRETGLLKKNEFLCPESFFSTENWPPKSISAIFKESTIISFSKFSKHLDMKRAATTPWSTNFAKIRSERVLRIKN